MRSERIDFEGHAGDRLAARLDLPDRAAQAFAVFAHCFTCGKDIAAARRISQALTRAGFGVLRFDFTGLGHSDGEFANTGFSSNVGDLIAAADWLAASHAAPQLLIGHSLGGAAVLAAAPKIPTAKAVVTIGAPADPAHVLETIGAGAETARNEGEADVSIAGRSFRISRSFVEDVSGASLLDDVSEMRRALLVMHAPQDQVVGIDNASRFFLAARHPKSFVSLDDADHLLSRETDARYAADVIAAWAGRYVDLPVLDEPAAAGLAEGSVRSSEVSADGFLQDVFTQGHHWLADEPRSVGGSNLGPTPYQLLGAGLAACTSMTIRMYARRKGIALSHVSTDVSHEKIHASDCESCESTSGRVDRFDRTITLSGELSEAEREKLLEIADKCPVHRTLEGEITVRTRLVD